MPKNEEVNPVYYEIQSDSEPTDESGTIVLDKKTVYDGEYSKDEGQAYQVSHDKLVDYKMVIGTDRSLYGLLKKNTDIFPNGPTVIDSRDGNVKIHNRNFNQNPKYVYTFLGGNGELISCSISTKNKSQNVQAEQNSTVDPLTKTVQTSVSQSCGDPDDELSRLNQTLYNVMTGTSKEEYRNQIIRSAKDEQSTLQELKSTYQVTKQDIENFMQQSKEQFKQLYEDAKTTGDISPILKANSLKKAVVKVKRYVRTRVNPVNYSTATSDWAKSDGMTQLRHRWGSGMKYLQSSDNIIVLGYTNGATGVKQNPDETGTFLPWAEVIMEKELNLELDGARILSSPLATEVQNSLSYSNLSNKTQKILEGDLKVIGRPGLVSSIIIYLNNISKKYSGEWYVTKVKHTISNSGYYCDLTLIKKGIPVVLSNITSNVDTKSIYSELHKLAKERTGSVQITDALLRQAFIEYIKANPEVEGKSLVLDLSNSKNGSFNIYPASDDQINIDKEREKYRK